MAKKRIALNKEKLLLHLNSLITLTESATLEAVSVSLKDQGAVQVEWHPDDYLRSQQSLRFR